MKSESTIARVLTFLKGAAVVALFAGLLAYAPEAKAASICESVVGNIVTNCGFEALPQNNQIPGWTKGGTNGVALSIPGYQNSGDRSLDLAFDPPGVSFASQNLGGAGTYSVSFWLTFYTGGIFSNPAPNVSITFGDQVLLVPNIVLGGQNPTYSQYQFSSVSTAAPADLRFEVSGSVSGVQYFEFLVDDVVVQLIELAPTQPSNVPEPSSSAMMIAGVAGLAFAARRRLS